MFSLIPESAELFEDELVMCDGSFSHPIRKIELSLNELEQMIANAREVGNREKAGTLNNREYLKSLGLIPLVKYRFIADYTENPRDEYIEKWLSIHV